MAVVKGAYALIIAQVKDATIAVGRLGECAFPAGYYIYLGRAGGGLFQRVQRHLRQEKRLRWHIDYLLKQAEVVEIWYTTEENPQECQLASAAAKMPGAVMAPTGFGSSDCRCRSHLIYCPRRPSFKNFVNLLGDAGRNVKRAQPAFFNRETGQRKRPPSAPTRLRNPTRSGQPHQ